MTKRTAKGRVNAVELWTLKSIFHFDPQRKRMPKVPDRNAPPRELTESDRRHLAAAAAKRQRKGARRVAAEQTARLGRHE